MDTDTLARLDRIERRIDSLFAFCNGVVKVITPMVPKMLRPVVNGVADKLRED